MGPGRQLPWGRHEGQKQPEPRARQPLSPAGLSPRSTLERFWPAPALPCGVQRSRDGAHTSSAERHCTAAQRGGRSFPSQRANPSSEPARITVRGFLQQPRSPPRHPGAAASCRGGKEHARGRVSVHRDPAPGSRVGHPTGTQIPEAVISRCFCIGETEKQRVILTAPAWQRCARGVKMTRCFSASPAPKCQRHQCSPGASQPCAKRICYQKMSSVGKFLSIYILTPPVLNPSSSQSTPVISASSPPLCLPGTKAVRSRGRCRGAGRGWAARGPDCTRWVRLGSWGLPRIARLHHGKAVILINPGTSLGPG